MKRDLFAALAGSLFGTGLLISGMTETDKVQGWLDVFGQWDPTLAFVLIGAILPMFFAWRYAENRAPVLGGSFPARPEQRLDRNLVLGGTLFGMGWGLAGLCPGPAIASLSYGGWEHALFFAAMLAGMLTTPKVREKLDSVVPAE